MRETVHQRKRREAEEQEIGAMRLHLGGTLRRKRQETEARIGAIPAKFATSTEP